MDKKAKFNVLCSPFLHAYDLFLFSCKIPVKIVNATLAALYNITEFYSGE